MADVLNVRGKPVFNEIFSSWEYHTHTPYASTTYNNNDEIRIPVHQSDIFTYPAESFLYIEGTLLEKVDKVNADYKLVNNVVAFLFEEARYEISGLEIDRVKNLGVTSTVKNYLTFDANDKRLSNIGWSETDGTVSVGSNGTFVFCYPLKYLLPVFEDYKKIILNVKQELVLLRASINNDAVVLPTGKEDFILTLTKVHWKIPYIRVEDVTRLDLLKQVNADLPIQIPFRHWELHEYPSFPQTKRQIWTVKTSSHMETPRYVIVAFQTGKKGVKSANLSRFNNNDISNVRLYLNSVYFPYDNTHGEMKLFYDMYSRFKPSYNCDAEAGPLLTQNQFQSSAPLYVIDCSKQNESLKSGSVDVRLEIETSKNMPANTTAYCIIVNDVIMEYKPLTGTVQKIL
jgi:hypothetical protein